MTYQAKIQGSSTTFGLRVFCSFLILGERIDTGSSPIPLRKNNHVMVKRRTDRFFIRNANTENSKNLLFLLCEGY